MNVAPPLLLAFVVSAILVPILRAVARRFALILPAAPESVAPPKALLGGLAVPLTLVIGSAATGVLSAVQVPLVCSGVLAFVGLASDLGILKRPSGTITKLVALVAVASVFLFFDARLRWIEEYVLLDRVLTVFWIVGITGAFDLLDHMDGLCAGVAVIAATAFLLTAVPGASDVALWARIEYLSLVLGAVAGFLIYNVHPASVVMGGAGSLVVGLNLAAMPLLLAPGLGSGLMSVIAVPALVLFIPILDALVMTVSRLVRGGSPGAKREFAASHRLVAIGLSERRAVGLMWVLAATGGLIGVVGGRNQYGMAGFAAVMFILGLTVFAFHLTRVEIDDRVGPNRSPGTLAAVAIRLGEVLLDFLLVTIAYYGAYRLRFQGSDYAPDLNYFSRSFPVILGTQVVALFLVGVYRGMWRYFGLSDCATLLKGVLLGGITSEVLLLYLWGFDGYSHGLFAVYGTLLFVLLVGSRASFRMVSEAVHRRSQSGRRLVIYGAGDAGATAVRHLLNDSHPLFRIVGFIDDDPRKRNMRVHGYRIIGGYDHMVGMIMARQIDAVAITPDAGNTSSLPWLCGKHGVRVYRVTLDWREIATDAAAARPVFLKAAEPRIVPYPVAARRRAQTRAALAHRVTETAADVGSRDERGLAVAAVADTADATSGSAQVAEIPTVAPIPVCHIITRLILGGAQENTLYTAIGQQLDPRFDVTLLCGIDEAGEGDMFSQVNRAGVKTVVLPRLMREIRPLMDIMAVFDVYRFLKRGDFTIVHTHSSKAGIIGRIAAWMAGVPIVVHTLHGLVFHEFQAAWKNNLFVVLKRICAPMTDKIISVSARVGEAALAKRIGRADQHVTIFSGIELDLFLSVRDRISVEEAKRFAGIPPAVPVVGKIARLFPLKGHEQFLAAAAHIVREVPDAHFLLVGDGPLREQLQAEAAALGLGDRVVMVGRIAPEAVPAYIHAMDVVVHTSLREGIARVLPQAGAVGKPVVTFELDGAPEVVQHGISGYLVPPVDTAAIAAHTVALLNDPARRRAFGEAGRSFAAAHFSVERMVERINSVYFELLNEKAGRRERQSRNKVSTVLDES